jgi:hypothetical protein
MTNLVCKKCAQSRYVKSGTITGPPEISVSGLRLSFHSDGGAEQAACDEGAGGVALCNGKHQL